MSYFQDEEEARIAKRQLAVGQEVKTRTGDHYVVDRKLGTGGMGEVYRVCDVWKCRHVETYPSSQ